MLKYMIIIAIWYIEIHFIAFGLAIFPPVRCTCEVATIPSSRRSHLKGFSKRHHRLQVGWMGRKSLNADVMLILLCLKQIPHPPAPFPLVWVKSYLERISNHQERGAPSVGVPLHLYPALASLVVYHRVIVVPGDNWVIGWYKRMAPKEEGWPGRGSPQVTYQPKLASQLDEHLLHSPPTPGLLLCLLPHLPTSTTRPHHLFRPVLLPSPPSFSSLHFHLRKCLWDFLWLSQSILAGQIYIAFTLCYWLSNNADLLQQG